MAEESIDIHYVLHSEEFARESSRIEAAIRGTENTAAAAAAARTENTQRRFDEEVERCRSYLERRMQLEERFHQDVARLRQASPGGGAEQEIEQRRAVRDAELQMLAQELGITEEGLIAFVDALIYQGTERLIALIGEAQTALAELGEDGDPGQRAEQQKRLSAAKKELERRDKKSADSTAAPTGKELKAWGQLQKLLGDVYRSFDEIGQAIGGTAGEAIRLGGEIATAMTGLIDNILQVAYGGTLAVQSTSQATAAAIRGVESASVILAVISAALQVATKIAQLFTKDHELSAEAVKSYEAYMEVTDHLIDKQKTLLDTVTGVQAVMASKEGIETIGKQIEATRDLGKAYLDSRKRNNRSYGYKIEKELVNYKEEIQAAGFDWDALKGRGDIEMEGLFDLSGREIERFREELPLIWSKIDDQARQYLETLVACDAKTEEVETATREALAGFSFDDARSELLKFLDDMDATFDDVAENFQSTMMHAINRVVASGLNDKLKAWYEKVGASMSDGRLSAAELTDLRQDYEEIYRQAIATRDAAYAAAGIVTEAEQGQAAGMSGEIRENITEETATRLEGLFRATYDKVAALNARADEQLLSVQGGFSDVRLILEREILIEEHTRRTADNTDGLIDQLKQIGEALNKGGGVYAK